MEFFETQNIKAITKSFGNVNQCGAMVDVLGNAPVGVTASWEPAMAAFRSGPKDPLLTLKW